MKEPPMQIDGAKVLEWAWSGERPFGVVCYDNGETASEIFGLAICRYGNDEKVYRFSCDANWETEHDSDYPSVEAAKINLPLQYRDVKANWKKYE